MAIVWAVTLVVAALVVIALGISIVRAVRVMRTPEFREARDERRRAESQERDR